MFENTGMYVNYSIKTRKPIPQKNSKVLLSKKNRKGFYQIQVSVDNASFDEKVQSSEEGEVFVNPPKNVKLSLRNNDELAKAVAILKGDKLKWSKQMYHLTSHAGNNLQPVAGQRFKARQEVRAQMKPEKVVFGETEYLRNKLGFCMPPTIQTLATGTPRLGVVGTNLGFRHLAMPRLQALNRLFSETEAAQRQEPSSRQITFKNPDPKMAINKSTKKDKKGFSECEQYVNLLQATSRRTKKVDEKAKFALSKDILHQQGRQAFIELHGQSDSNILATTKSKLDEEKEKESQRKLEDINRRQTKILAPKRKRRSSDYSENNYNVSKFVKDSL